MVEFTLSVDDLVAFAAWQARASGEEDRRRARLAVVGAWIAGAIAYLVVFLVLPMILLLAGQLALAAAGEVLALLVGGAAGLWEWRRGRIGEWLLRRRYRARATVALERTGAARRLWLDDDGLNITAGERSNRVRWAGITRVVETDDYVFVYTGPETAHVIPRRVGPAVADLVTGIRSRLLAEG